MVYFFTLIYYSIDHGRITGYLNEYFQFDKFFQLKLAANNLKISLKKYPYTTAKNIDVVVMDYKQITQEEYTLNTEPIQSPPVRK